MDLLSLLPCKEKNNAVPKGLFKTRKILEGKESFLAGVSQVNRSDSLFRMQMKVIAIVAVNYHRNISSLEMFMVLGGNCKFC